MLGEPHSQSEHFKEEKILRPCHGSSSLQPSHYADYAILLQKLKSKRLKFKFLFTATTTFSYSLLFLQNKV
jgi:hypothetical protein